MHLCRSMVRFTVKPHCEGQALVPLYFAFHKTHRYFLNQKKAFFAIDTVDDGNKFCQPTLALAYNCEAGYGTKLDIYRCPYRH